jgi:hypothetical protein
MDPSIATGAVVLLALRLALRLVQLRSGMSLGPPPAPVTPPQALGGSTATGGNPHPGAGYGTDECHPSNGAGHV